MTAVAATKRIYAEEFLSLVETEEKSRYELYEGQVFAMAPAQAGLSINIADIFA